MSSWINNSNAPISSSDTLQWKTFADVGATKVLNTVHLTLANTGYISFAPYLSSPLPFVVKPASEPPADPPAEPREFPLPRRAFRLQFASA